MAKKNTSLFHDMKFNWKQMGVFKLSTISFGILLAAYFPDVFFQNIMLIWLIFIVSGAYILYLYFNK